MLNIPHTTNPKPINIMRLNPEFFGDSSDKKEEPSTEKIKFLEELPAEILTKIAGHKIALQKLMENQSGHGDQDPLLTVVAMQANQIRTMCEFIMQYKKVLDAVVEKLGIQTEEPKEDNDLPF